jgi:hypothetical protein
MQHGCLHLGSLHTVNTVHSNGAACRFAAGAGNATAVLVNVAYRAQPSHYTNPSAVWHLPKAPLATRPQHFRDGMIQYASPSSPVHQASQACRRWQCTCPDAQLEPAGAPSAAAAAAACRVSRAGCLQSCCQQYMAGAAAPLPLSHKPYKQASASRGCASWHSRTTGAGSGRQSTDAIRRRLGAQYIVPAMMQLMPPTLAIRPMCQ